MQQPSPAKCRQRPTPTLPTEVSKLGATTPVVSVPHSMKSRCSQPCYPIQPQAGWPWRPREVSPERKGTVPERKEKLRDETVMGEVTLWSQVMSRILPITWNWWERGKVSKCSHKKNMISLTSDPMLRLIVSQLSFDTWPPPSVMQWQHILVCVSLFQVYFLAFRLAYPPDKWHFYWLFRRNLKVDLHTL